MLGWRGSAATKSCYKASDKGQGHRHQDSNQSSCQCGGEHPPRQGKTSEAATGHGSPCHYYNCYYCPTSSATVSMPPPKATKSSPTCCNTNAQGWLPSLPRKTCSSTTHNTHAGISVPTETKEALLGREGLGREGLGSEQESLLLWKLR